jgi:hypothetical protein
MAVLVLWQAMARQRLSATAWLRMQIDCLVQIRVPLPPYLHYSRLEHRRLCWASSFRQLLFAFANSSSLPPTFLTATRSASSSRATPRASSVQSPRASSPPPGCLSPTPAPPPCPQQPTRRRTASSSSRSRHRCRRSCGVLGRGRTGPWASRAVRRFRQSPSRRQDPGRRTGLKMACLQKVTPRVWTWRLDRRTGRSRIGDSRWKRSPWTADPLGLARQKGQILQAVHMPDQSIAVEHHPCSVSACDDGYMDMYPNPP